MAQFDILPVNFFGIGIRPSKLAQFRYNHAVTSCKKYYNIMVAEAGLELVLRLTFGSTSNWCGPVCGARKKHRAYAFPRFFRPRHSKPLPCICHRQRSPFLGEQCLFGIVGWPCCGDAVCASATARRRCTPTAATRSASFICHWQRSPRSPNELRSSVS